MRRYLPSFAELVDRMCIVLLKEVFIPENREAYRKELNDILYDIDEELKDKPLDGEAVRAIAVLMLTNRFIWENESKARKGGAEQDKLLKLTHSINGVRNTAKNVISKSRGERVDLKIDCFAAEFGEEYGNWNVFSKEN
ncbi:MAG TPA: hypothetical protein VIY48_08545 [Candidatus Paceibacterota bacterium]